MCKVQMLRVLVDQRLTAAVEEIFVVLARTIAEYEEKLSRTKEENERQRQLLDAVFKKHQVVLHRADVSEEHLPPEQQEWSSRVEQEEPKHPHIKREECEPQCPHIKQEEEAHSISLKGPHLEGLEEFPVIGVAVKGEDDEDKGQSEEKREVELPSSSSTEHITEADGGHSGGSQADNCLAPLSDSDCTMSHTPGKTFKRGSNLQRRMIRHKGEKPFMCSVCGKSFYETAHLEVHTRIHTRERCFSCSVCGKSFYEKAYLQVHTRIHTGERRFSCSVCGKRFVRKSHLKVHTRIHTGEKPFSCSVCGKRCNVKSNLKVHIMTHHSETACAMNSSLKSARLTTTSVLEV
ncbi:zinc finger protein 510-like [Dunckerocampus dactyliophorus]|uniref:zinc finger protein 510-like n=1 Tax=Dunckerocampus dactyliophorus TaxID=161453 RepID=UPI002405F46B|nr:zinc finger protein 510-like [Dunckerocampus dactyliophorus]